MSYIDSSTCIANHRPTRTRRLRRGLVALSIAVALPGAFITSQAAAGSGESSPVVAYDANVARDGDANAAGPVQAKTAPLAAPCYYLDHWYPSGTWIDHMVCSNGRMVLVQWDPEQ